VTAPLRVVQLLAPAPFGGLESVVVGLAQGLAGRGHTVVVGAVVDPSVRPQDHPFLNRCAEIGAEVRVLRVSSRSYRRERALVRELLSDVRPDVFHSHGYRPDVLDAPVAARMRIPTISTVHGFTRGSARNRFYEAVQRRALRRFDAVVAVSRSLGSELAASGVTAPKLHVVPNALPTLPKAIDAVEARARLGAEAGEFHLAWIGRLSEEKGPDVLLEALALLTDRSWIASIVGDGPLAPTLRARWSAEGRNGVRWHGVIDGIARYLSGVDCLVMSSRTEGTPIVLLEAMASGVPVVATAVGGVPDVAEGVALLVPAEDPLALAEAIVRVRADSELRRRMAAAGIRRVRERYGPEGWLERYEGIYQGVLDPGRRAQVAPGDSPNRPL
jgi:glycosyltransferase involved in cell wall biosynthesis